MSRLSLQKLSNLSWYSRPHYWLQRHFYLPHCHQFMKRDKSGGSKLPHTYSPLFLCVKLECYRPILYCIYPPVCLCICWLSALWLKSCGFIFPETLTWFFLGADLYIIQHIQSRLSQWYRCSASVWCTTLQWSGSDCSFWGSVCTAVWQGCVHKADFRDCQCTVGFVFTSP